jgi:hypothetical protein
MDTSQFSINRCASQDGAKPSAYVLPEYDSDKSDFSDDMVLDINTPDALAFELRFGKYKGRTLGQMIKNGKRRAYLRYLLGWDDLKYQTRHHIKVALEDYKQRKKEHTEESKKQK